MAHVEFPDPNHPEYLSPAFLEAAAQSGIEPLKIGNICKKQSPHQVGQDWHDGTVKVFEIDPTGSFAKTRCVINGCDFETIVSTVL